MVAVVLSLAVLGLIVADKLASPPHLERRIAAIVGPKYKVDIGDARYNPIRGTFSADYIAIEPDTVNYKEARRKTWNFTATAIRIDGIRHWALLRKNLDAREIHLDTPRLGVYLDRRVDPKKIHKPSVLPQEHLRRLKKEVRIDNILVTDGEIVLTEVAIDGVRPGTFVFADIAAMITNVSNDPSRMSLPCSIDVRSRLADEGAMHGIFEYDLSSDSLTIDGEGTIGKMEASKLNDLILNLNGIYVRGGTIDSTWFEMHVKEDVATGKVRCLYRGMEFVLVDKNSHEQNFKHQMMNLFKETRDANPHEPGQLPMTAAVHLRREPDDNVIKFVWLTVRQGLMRTLGVIN